MVWGSLCTEAIERNLTRDQFNARFPRIGQTPSKVIDFSTICCVAEGGRKKLLKYSVQYSTLCAKGSKANTGSVANCYQSCFSVSTKLLLILIKVRVLKNEQLAKLQYS